MKNLLAILVCLALAGGLAACGNRQNSSSSLPAQSSAPEVSESETQSMEDGSQEDDALPQVSKTFEDENVSIVAEMAREGYTLDEEIDIAVTVTNKSTTDTIAFTMGSSSNTVPDALQLDLGGLAPLYQPEIMLMDYHVETLGPGQSATYKLHHVAYIPNDPLASYGTDKDLPFFQEGDFTPAEPGEVTARLQFAYVVVDQEGEDDLSLFMGDDDATIISGEFTTNILETV